MNEYIERYRELCSKLSDDPSKSSVRKNNRISDKLSKLADEIRKLDSETVKLIMKTLLNDESVNVRASACTFCLKEGIYRERVMEIFKEIMDNREKYSWRIIGIVHHCRFCLEHGYL